MRPGQQNKRGRGRGNSGGSSGGGNPSSGGSSSNNNNNNNFNRKGSNPLTRTYDSSGPDVKIRGTAQHIAEKYSTLARDSHSSGDRVMAENYLQHAEHYYRIIAAAQAQMQERFQREDRPEFGDRDGNERDMDDMDGNEMDDQPMIAPQMQSRNAPQQSMPQQPAHGPVASQQSSPAPQPAPVQQDAAPVQADQPQPDVPREPRQPRQPRQPRVFTPRTPVEAPAVVNDGTGPQPEIVGIPAEVAIEEAQGTEEPRTPRRRAAGRPRRPRLTDGEAGSEGGDGTPNLADAASE
jgi:Domain of unknown function (DUF4167)